MEDTNTTAPAADVSPAGTPEAASAPAETAATTAPVSEAPAEATTPAVDGSLPPSPPVADPVPAATAGVGTLTSDHLDSFGKPKAVVEADGSKSHNSLGIAVEQPVRKDSDPEDVVVGDTRPPDRKSVEELKVEAAKKETVSTVSDRVDSAGNPKAPLGARTMTAEDKLEAKKLRHAQLKADKDIFIARGLNAELAELAALEAELG